MRVKRVSFLREYKLKILFSNGKTKIVNLEDKIKKAKGIFLALKNLEYFKKVALDDCLFSICWPNGADICPDVLYHMGEDIAEKEKGLIRKKKNIRKSHSKYSLSKL